MQKARHFDVQEDKQLIQLVEKYGTNSWNLVAADIGNRTARQCRNRYTFFLAPDVNNSPWTEEEEALLVQKYNEMGPKWAAFRSFFPGRTRLNIKDHFKVMCNRKEKVQTDKNSHEKKTLSDYISDLESLIARSKYLEDLLVENNIRFDNIDVWYQNQNN